MRRLVLASAYVAAAALATTAIVHCSSVTELVVVVDTDLRAGDEVDEIVVTVDDGAGFTRNFPKKVSGPDATTLPLTLGVNAGSDPNAKVTVRAVARLGGKDVASAGLRTSMVDGESKMAHVSICRSCATTSCATADVEGSALPAWSGSPPSAPSCIAPPIVTDGGDAGSVDASDGSSGDAADAGDASDAAPPLLAYWDFEEDAGAVVFDKSGNGRDVAFGGTTVKRGAGMFGGGLLFSRLDSGLGGGTLDCVPIVTSLIGTSGTLSFWWRDDDDAPAGTLPSSVGVFAEQTSNRDHLFFQRFGNQAPQRITLAFQFKTTDASFDDYANGDAGSPFNVVKGQWTRLVMTWTPNGATLRVGKGASATTIPFYRAWAPMNQNCFFGKNALGALDDVRFYGRPLTDAEIADLP